VLKIETDDLMVGSYYYVGITGPGWNRTYYVDFRVTNATDLREVGDDSPKVMLYPVPVKDLLNINAPGLSNDEWVVLYDLTGRRLMEALLGDAPLNLGHLKSGVYLLVVDGQTYKVVKQ
ncbi:MAG: T9SS type A sorting domain-containing protein, partial [Bacteroidales bacterium]|nr:T9SS type A sorting domain-containing protein [Bacteroidales bacterium]